MLVLIQYKLQLESASLGEQSFGIVTCFYIFTTSAYCPYHVTPRLISFASILDCKYISNYKLRRRPARHPPRVHSSYQITVI
jgi:hypothetical protein